MVRAMFDEDPAAERRVGEVFKKLGVTPMPVEAWDEDRTAYWQRLTKHFLAEGDEAFAEDQPFYVVDLGRLVVQMARWKRELPMVRAYYALKCNPSPMMLEVIAALGGGFDCASQGEIELVLGADLVSPQELIFANPCKMASHMRAAAAAGVEHVTFDNEAELRKIAQHMPSARAVLRIRTDDSAAVCQFSIKFGCAVPAAGGLLQLARELGVNIVGVSFHVGSGNNDPAAYVNAVMNARRVFDQANELGFEMKLLDIGGGFPGTEPACDASGTALSLSFEDIAAALRPVLAEHFHNAHIIGEPGRFFAASTHCLAMSVHSKRHIVTTKGPEVQYYVTDGLYHSFNCMFFDHASPALHRVEDADERAMHVSTIFGPTCDSLDRILTQRPFPELDIGDWLFVPDFGAYTVAAGAPFNGFATRRLHVVSSAALVAHDC